MSIEAIHQRDPGDENPTPRYTYLDVETVGKLDHTCHLMSEAQRRLNTAPSLMYAFSYEKDNGELGSVLMDERFLWGVWWTRRGLVKDLAERGHGDTARDITARWEARS